MVWPPTKDFTDFIASLVENSELCFDPKITDTVSGADEESRYAGHCLLWARTSALGIGEIQLKALVNVGNIFAYRIVARVTNSEINFWSKGHHST